MDKLKKDGKVAVLYTPSYGSGYGSAYPEIAKKLIFDKDIAEAIDKYDFDLAKRILKNKFPGFYFGDINQLKIKWLEEGTLFEINEFDGYEEINIIYKDIFVA